MTATELSQSEQHRMNREAVRLDVPDLDPLISRPSDNEARVNVIATEETEPE